MINTHYHHSADILATFPHHVLVGGVPQLDIEDSIPDLLVLTAAIVNKLGESSRLPNGGDRRMNQVSSSLPSVSCPIGSQTCALNKHHDV